MGDGSGSVLRAVVDGGLLSRLLILWFPDSEPWASDSAPYPFISIDIQGLRGLVPIT
jgi:hypothetical protein